MLWKDYEQNFEKIFPINFEKQDSDMRNLNIQNPGFIHEPKPDVLSLKNKDDEGIANYTIDKLSDEHNLEI